MLGLKDLSKNLATKKGISVTQATEMLKDVIEVLEDACATEGGFAIQNSFTVETKFREGRTGSINGVAYTSDGTKYIKAKAGKLLTEKLNAN